jgi:hypothetical protein
MKRIIFAILVLALTSLAALNAVDSFDVDTEVEGVNKMKITTYQYSSTIPEDLEGADSFGSLNVQSAGTQTVNAWLSTMSNNRAGYTVSMSATAMKSSITEQTDAYINYTVTVNGESIITNNTTSSPTSVVVISVTDLTQLSVESKQIGLTVDSATFNSAVAGSYSGTVTFTFSAK